MLTGRVVKEERAATYKRKKTYTELDIRNARNRDF